MKGIIIAGGNGTRLTPLTSVISKALLPVYDKPMIYYPLTLLVEVGIKEILIITIPKDKQRFEDLLGDGKQFGLTIKYEVEPMPKGIAQAFVIGEDFISHDHVTLLLADNIFYGEHLISIIKKSMKKEIGATIFGVEVPNPKEFGVVEFNKEKVISIEEKPVNPKSNYAVTGLYIYDNQVIQIAKNLVPSQRGEFEITDVNKAYLEMGDLNVELLGKSISWFDTGTHSSLLEATNFIKKMEQKQNIKIGCIEEVAYKNGLITKEQLKLLTKQQLKSEYGEYLRKSLEKGNAFK